jgi:thymidine kinase
MSYKKYNGDYSYSPSMDKIGYLEIILGPMFSGKTTHIIDLYHSYITHGKKVLVVNFSGDVRYHDSMLSSHDKVIIPCIFLTHLSELFKTEIDADIVLINEGQFFDDVFECVKIMVEERRLCVHVCGLDGDFKRGKFGGLLDLIPLCDTVRKLHANCVNCRLPAIFSHRITDEVGQVSIGSSNYIALCRDCYQKLSITK